MTPENELAFSNENFEERNQTNFGSKSFKARRQSICAKDDSTIATNKRPGLRVVGKGSWKDFENETLFIGKKFLICHKKGLGKNSPTSSSFQLPFPSRGITAEQVNAFDASLTVFTAGISHCNRNQRFCGGRIGAMDSSKNF